MTAATPPASSLLDAFRRNERRLAVVWLTFTLLLTAAVLVAPVRSRLLARIQRLADRYDDRWDERLQAGEQLVAARRFPEAAAYLARLDEVYPARHARYARDKEREHLLRLLAQSYEGEGKNGRAMETWSRLVAFDSLNYANHFGYAQAAERILSGWALAPEARDGYLRALQLSPSHLPSLRGYVDYYMDRGEFHPVVDAYKTYLDAFLIQRITLSAGDSAVSIGMLVDGQPHDVDVAFARPPGWKGELVLSSSVYPIAVERIAVVPATAVGRVSARVVRSLDIANMSASHMRRSGAGWTPTDSTGSLRIPVTADSTGIARVQLTLRVFKVVDASLWALVVKSFKNLLDAPGLAAASARTAPFVSVAAADTAFGRLEWPRSGQYVRGER